MFSLPVQLLAGASKSDWKVVIPIVEDAPKQHLYYHELLKEALKQAGVKATYDTPRYPQLRIKNLLDVGKVTLYWMVESEERNKKYLPIRVNLTNGLIGKRILFIRKKDQIKFNAIKNIEDFRLLSMTGGMGEGWFDVKVWAHNKLKYKEQSGNWRKIYKMLAQNREYDYFSRGLNEILMEAKDHPELHIEQNLAFIYDRDFRFYMSRSGENARPQHRIKVEEALKSAEKSGLIKELVEKYWGNIFQKLNYSNRTMLYLNTPR